MLGSSIAGKLRVCGVGRVLVVDGSKWGTSLTCAEGLVAESALATSLSVGGLTSSGSMKGRGLWPRSFIGVLGLR